MDLGDLRTQIDAVDEQIVDLYERRMDICRQVAEVKIETGKKVFDRDREKEKIAKVKSLTHTDFNKTGIGELFEQIMSMSRKLQYQLLTEKGTIGRLPFIGVDSLGDDRVRVVFQGAEELTPRQLCISISGMRLTASMWIPSGMPAVRSKREALILRCFPLKIPRREL